MKRLLFIILILMLAWNAYAIPPTPPVAAGDGSGDVLAGTMGSTGQYCTKNAATKTIDCNTTPSYQAALDIAKGTYTNTYLCKYTSSGTLLDCNVDPAGFQTANATLTALAAQTESQGALQYYTADATPAVLAKGTAYQLLQMNSGATAPEWTSSLSISALNLTSATSSIPWVVGTASAPTTEGQAYWNSSTNTLTIGNGATATALASTTYKPADLAIASQAAGDVLYFDGTNWVRLAADAGKYLKSGASAVSWDTPAGTGDFKADGSVPFTAALVPNAANTVALGSTSAEIADIYLGDGAIIYGQNDSSNTITSSSTGWSFAKAITIADVANDNYLKITNNSGGRAPTASVYEIYPDAGVWKLNTNGAESTIAVVKNEKLASFAWDGGASAVATSGSKRCVAIPYAATIVGWTMVISGDPGAGGTILNITKDAWSDSALPTTEIDASDPPTVADDKVAATDAAPTGWTTAVTANDIICADVATNAVATWISLTIYGTK